MTRTEDDLAITERSGEQLEFHALGRRAVLGKFNGAKISAGGGGLLLVEVEARTGIIARLAEQFSDDRDPAAMEHRVRELLGQRVLGLALGYEDLNDHDPLRLDPGPDRFPRARRAPSGGGRFRPHSGRNPTRGGASALQCGAPAVRRRSHPLYEGCLLNASDGRAQLRVL